LSLPHLAAWHPLALPFRGHHLARLHRPPHGPQDLFAYHARHEHGLPPPRRGRQVPESVQTLIPRLSEACQRVAGQTRLGLRGECHRGKRVVVSVLLSTELPLPEALTKP